jgi:hypothetical protein
MLFGKYIVAFSWGIRYKKLLRATATVTTTDQLFRHILHLNRPPREHHVSSCESENISAYLRWSICRRASTSFRTLFTSALRTTPTTTSGTQRLPSTISHVLLLCEATLPLLVAAWWKPPIWGGDCPGSCSSIRRVSIPSPRNERSSRKLLAQIWTSKSPVSKQIDLLICISL